MEERKERGWGNSRKNKKRWFFAALILSGLLFIRTLPDWENTRLTSPLLEEGNLNVHFMDVGQGNGILVESDGHYMLLDGGDVDSYTFVSSYLKTQGVRKLDYLIASHYDTDHISGLIGALYQYPAEVVMTADYKADTWIYKRFRSALKKAGSEELHPKKGEAYQLGEAEFTILGPDGYGHETENDNSICIRLVKGENSFLFCGDAQKEAESELVEDGNALKSDVYMVNHHGSASSSAMGFLKAVSPEYAVISCDKRNAYGHPKKSVLKRLKKLKVKLFRTDQQGTVIASSDGKKISWNVNPVG